MGPASRENSCNNAQKGVKGSWSCPTSKGATIRPTLGRGILRKPRDTGGGASERLVSTPYTDSGISSSHWMMVFGGSLLPRFRYSRHLAGRTTRTRRPTGRPGPGGRCTPAPDSPSRWRGRDLAPRVRLSGRAGTLPAMRSTEDERMSKPVIDRQTGTYVRAEATSALRRGRTERRFLVSVVWADGRTFTRLVRATSQTTAWRYAWNRAGDPVDSGSVNITSVRVVPAACLSGRPGPLADPPRRSSVAPPDRRGCSSCGLTSCSDPWLSRARRASMA